MDAIYDWTVILTAIAGVATVLGCVYSFLRNFKTDIQTQLEKMERKITDTEMRMEKKMDDHEKRAEQRMQKMEQRIDALDERMFFILTGRKLEDAILEEKVKRVQKEVS